MNEREHELRRGAGGTEWEGEVDSLLRREPDMGLHPGTLVS